jgi:uncharacterized membrane protein
VPELNASIYIEASVEEVFAFVDDWRNTTRFVRGLLRWDPVDPTVTRGVGLRTHAVLQVGPTRLEGEMEVVEHVPNERVAYRSVRGPRIEGQWTFHPRGQGTVVDLRNTFELPGGIAGRVVAPIVNSQGRRDLEASLAELKRLVESGEG